MGYINNKFTNVRVGQEFNDILSAHKLFQGDNYKLISPCHFLLNKIHADCALKKMEFAPLYHKYIQDKFRPYNVNYRPYIDALLDLGLLEIKLNDSGAETYLHAQNKEDSICKQYRATAKCAKLLEDANKEYLRKLHDDPQIKRLVKRNKDQNFRRLKDTGDLVIDNTKHNLFELRYEKREAEKVLDLLSKPPEGKDSTRERARAKNRVNNAEHSLIHIKEGDFKVNRCGKDGRIHNTWTLMNSNLRQICHIHHNDTILFPSYTIDLRAAHPTFFGIYLKNVYFSNKYYKFTNNTSNSISSTTSPMYSHYATDIEAYFKCELLKEVERWNELWTNPAIDPRDVIAKDLGRTKEYVKDKLNKAINDPVFTNKLHLWIKNNFPFLHFVWTRTPIKQTGNNISMQYESNLFRDNQLQAFVNGIEGIKVMDEHDGLTVFAAFDDTQTLDKVKTICDFLVDSCHAQFEIKPVIKIGNVAQLN